MWKNKHTSQQSFPDEQMGFTMLKGKILQKPNLITAVTLERQGDTEIIVSVDFEREGGYHEIYRNATMLLTWVVR